MSACLALRLAPLAFALILSGCGTISLPSHQPLQILAFDALDRPVAGLDCTVSNTAGEWQVKTPATDVPVRRSFSDLEIACRRGNEVAMGTVVPRRDRVEQALVPFGSVAVAIDHLTGHLYSYPTVVRLRLGQHLRFEFSTEARAAGLIATVGDTLVVDLAATPAPQQPLPAARSAGSDKPVARAAAGATRPRPSTAASAASAATATASARKPARPAVPSSATSAAPTATAARTTRATTAATTAAPTAALNATPTSTPPATPVTTRAAPLTW